MTKFKKILIIVCMSVLMLSLVVICANAEESNTHSSCLEEHFSWIEDEDNQLAGTNETRIPENVRGSCSYVAMSLLLSFYDAYWHDDFIPSDVENNVDYETEGVINTSGEISMDFNLALENNAWEGVSENLVSGSQEEKTAYINFIDEHKDEFFHLYLIWLAKDRNYHPFEIAYGLINVEMVAFLEYYLYEVCHFTRDQVTVNLMTELTATQDQMYAKAREQIEKGFPFMYTGLMINPTQDDSENVEGIGGHVLLGYKFTDPDEKDDIVLSYCWNESPTTTFYTNEFKYYSGIIWLDINIDALPHSHSVSYISSDNSNGYCACEIYSKHSNHSCKIAGTQEEACPVRQGNEHCFCGKTIERHNYYIGRYTDASHWYECSCGDIMTVENHTLVSVYSNESSTHFYYCDCGYRTEPDTHFMSIHSQYDLFDETYFNMREHFHRASCECGYEEPESHNFVFYKYGQWICEECGYIRTELGGGGNIIMGKKEDEYDE